MVPVLINYLCISIISRNVMFSGTVSDYLFMYFYYFQKSRNVMFSGTVPDYLFISIISRSPEMLCFQALCTLQDRFISVVSF